MWETILATVLVGIASAVLGQLGKAVRDWSAREKQKSERDKKREDWLNVVEAVEVGVAKAGADLVEKAKEDAADGKLSMDIIKEAQIIAKTTALQVASQISGSAAQLLGRMAADTVTGIIELVLGRKKSGNK